MNDFHSFNFLTGIRPPELAQLPEHDVAILRQFLERALDRHVAVARVVHDAVTTPAGIDLLDDSPELKKSLFYELRNRVEQHRFESLNNEQHVSRIHEELGRAGSDWLGERWANAVHEAAFEVLGIDRDEGEGLTPVVDLR